MQFSVSQGRVISSSFSNVFNTNSRIIISFKVSWRILIDFPGLGMKVVNRYLAVIGLLISLLSSSSGVMDCM